ncbi:MAG TPA: RNA polymerase sigma factor [Thermoleophilaceae bacterium]|nr:RNA polymerase sigma factor [Thermoleophilaceae bacterium]
MPDLESREWVASLRAGDEEAVARLHGLLLRAARFEIGRRRHTLPHLRGDDWDDLAHQAADDALVAVLRKLSDFRGKSRFTTWAYKFALYEAADMLRRRAWQARELPLTAEGWEVLASPPPAAPAETGELFAAIAEGIAEQLTTHQRDVLVAVTLNDVPIDVLAERLATTRGALYKTLHDARRKLRAYLADRGFDISGATDG